MLRRMCCRHCSNNYDILIMSSCQACRICETRNSFPTLLYAFWCICYGLVICQHRFYASCPYVYFNVTIYFKFPTVYCILTTFSTLVCKVSYAVVFCKNQHFALCVWHKEIVPVSVPVRCCHQRSLEKKMTSSNCRSCVLG